MYSEIILSTHAFVPIGELKLPADILDQKLTIRSQYDPNLAISLAKITDTHFGYPLYLHNYAAATDHLVDARSAGTPIDVSMAGDFSLRDNQKPVLERFEREIATGITGWLLNMPTGAGKTVCACKMLQLLGRTTLIIVPRESLMQQWVQRIQQFTDIREEEIGTAQQNICDYEGKKVVLGMIHSLSKDKYPQAFKDYFGLVIWDEVHVAAAASFSQTLSIFAPRYRIGMSATLKRSDGLEEIYRYAIGESLLSISAKTLITPKVCMQAYKAKTIDRSVNAIQSANYRRARLISHLAKDKVRNALVAKHIAQAARNGRRTVCFSERIQQLTTLRDLLLAQEGVNENEVGLFTGETNAADRERILAKSPIILATYGVMAMGVDVPDLRAIVFGTPKADVTQAVGRILRINDQARQPLVIDIVDTVYLDCQHWAKSRERYYTKIAQASIERLE
ncbi:MAG: DEAD/DEAH box helicase [Desulfovibrionaceae bacterium]|nr:DEAD/DEAH box helicase [Desulfovibrionaceae bacterium]